MQDEADAELAQGRDLGRRRPGGHDHSDLRSQLGRGVGQAEAVVPGRRGDDRSSGVLGQRGRHRRQSASHLERTGGLERFELGGDRRTELGRVDDGRHRQVAPDLVPRRLQVLWTGNGDLTDGFTRHAPTVWPRGSWHAGAVVEPGPRRFDGATAYVHSALASMARAAADEAAAVLREAVAQRGEAHAMFATGNSQLEFVRVLVEETADVPWAETVVFHMDEYVGVGPDHPAGFQRWIRERIVIPTRPKAAHYLEGRADPAAECSRYAALLAALPLDLCCLGIGENGHLAFNDPPVADFNDPLDVKVVELDAACRRQQVNEGHFPTWTPCRRTLSP